MTFLRELFDFIRDYWEMVALLATWAGIGYVYVRKRGHWKSKRFMDQVNFSLNYLKDGRLVMRTLIELPAHEVWLNQHGVSLVTAAAQKTTVDDPFIKLKDAKDQQFVNRAVLNALSERFADSFVAQALGLPVQTSGFYFVITCEKYETIRTHKLRVLIMSEKMMHEDFAQGGPGDTLAAGDPVYEARQKTLRRMRQLHAEDEKRGGNVVGWLELGLPK